jgi:Mn-dependent DtxR family transcriptional regulator
VGDLRISDLSTDERSTEREHLGTLDKRSARVEDYVEIIDQLVQTKGYARGIEIAEKLRVSQPTVTSMLQRLSSKELVLYEKHRGVILTTKGRSLARTMRHSHITLTEFLEVLGIDEELANRVAEDMEHCLPSDVIDKIESLTRCLRENPSLISQQAIR